MSYVTAPEEDELYYIRCYWDDASNDTGGVYGKGWGKGDGHDCVMGYGAGLGSCGTGAPNGWGGGGGGEYSGNTAGGMEIE